MFYSLVIVALYSVTYFQEFCIFFPTDHSSELLNKVMNANNKPTIIKAAIMAPFLYESLANIGAAPSAHISIDKWQPRAQNKVLKKY